MSIKRLYRSRTDRILAGIFGGLGQYFEVDSVLLRLVWLVLFVVTGFFPGAIIYLVAIFVIPLEAEAHAPTPQVVDYDIHPMVQTVPDTTAVTTPKIIEEKRA